ncbi:LOW QUALITY PROTEIN: ZF-HD_dimer domain-containing protein, partial [Cephalotus follicularis]
ACYKECLKNHAASKGGHVVDGCGEFMPSGEDGTTEALKCAACECHRNFHRKEIDGEYSHGFSTGPLTAPIVPMMMTFGGGSGGGATESSSEDLNMFQSNEGQSSVQPMHSKKRFRTRFSQEQKEKMMELAEKLGWKIQKQDEQEVLRFCSQVGLKRQVFKVWMHNNKQAMKKKQM